MNSTLDSPLELAAKCDIGRLKAALDAGAYRQKTHRAKARLLALLGAVCNGHSEFVEPLLAKGANVFQVIEIALSALDADEGDALRTSQFRIRLSDGRHAALFALDQALDESVHADDLCTGQLILLECVAADSCGLLRIVEFTLLSKARHGLFGNPLHLPRALDHSARILRQLAATLRAHMLS